MHQNLMISVNAQAKNQKLQTHTNELVLFVPISRHQFWSDHYQIWHACWWDVRTASV